MTVWYRWLQLWLCSYRNSKDWGVYTTCISSVFSLWPSPFPIFTLTFFPPHIAVPFPYPSSLLRPPLSLSISAVSLSFFSYLLLSLFPSPPSFTSLSPSLSISTLPSLLSNLLLSLLLFPSPISPYHSPPLTPSQDSDTESEEEKTAAAAMAPTTEEEDPREKSR